MCVHGYARIHAHRVGIHGIHIHSVHIRVETSTHENRISRRTITVSTMNENSNDSNSNSTSIVNNHLVNGGAGQDQGPSTSTTSSSISTLLPQPFDGEESTISEYMFESDHAALKGNEDYQNLLNDLVMYEAKRIQALEDMNKLIEIEEKALQDPIKFVNQLQNGVDVGIPKPIDIPQPLLIDWDKYTSIPEHLIGLNRRLSMRKIFGKLDQAVSETASNPDMAQDDDSNHSAPVVVRGRVKDEHKPETFNQLWTVDEQKRLEELLVKYPPEEVESKRFQKIATALGNRTPIQVQSRIQKYFIKLAKAGLPVPGRIPRSETRYKRSVPLQHATSARDRYYLHPSTFMQSHQPPVYMSDDDEPSPAPRSYRGRLQDVSDEEDIPEELRASEEYRELLRLKRVRRERQIQRLGETNGAEHTGYKCDRCEMNPIRGTRWNCQDCPQDVSVDLCSLCADSPFETSVHDSRHRLVPIHSPLPQSHVDRDYLKFAPSGYNYLDPNYMPAT